VAAIQNLFVRLKKDSGTQVSKKLSKKWTLDNQNWKLISPFRHETNLTTKELSFLQLLVSEKGNPVSRNKLLTSLGYHSDGPYGNRALDVMIVRLRKKIKSNIREEVPIRTVHSVGFCFSAPAKQI
jgi:DNA-binding response OmpR family regulator